MLDLPKLFDMQKKLNERITTEHNLQEKNLFVEQILALEVELGELANETRCFKYWSNKPPAAKEVIIEEYVDGLHFILSIGLALKFEQVELEQKQLEKEQSLVNLFQEVFERIANLHKRPTMDNYQNLFQTYLRLGQQLGFTEVEMELAYYEKNKVNHERQDQGY